MNQGRKGGAKAMNSFQTMQTAKMLGLSNLTLNMYQAEKSQISRSLERINLFRREIRMMLEDIKQREA